MTENNPEDEREYRAITSQPDDGILDIPHEPDAEAALIQEVRERLLMLERHIGDPEAVFALRELDDDLESIMYNVAAVEEYECDCSMIE